MIIIYENLVIETSNVFVTVIYTYEYYVTNYVILVFSINNGHIL